MPTVGVSPATACCVLVTPHSISPAYTEKATAKVKMAVTQSWRKLFICFLLINGLVESHAKNFASVNYFLASVRVGA